MARIRTIKPEFFTHDLLAEVEPLGRLLFVGLWCVADREGRLEYRPRRLKTELLPYDECDIEVLLAQLADRGFLRLYEVDGTQYVQVENFTRHQYPNVKERASTIPAPCNHDAGTMTASLEGKGREQEGKEGLTAHAHAHAPAPARGPAPGDVADDAGASPPITVPRLSGKRPAVQPVYEEGSEPMVLAAEFCERLREHKPDIRLPRDLQRWARSFDLMMRTDHRPREKIEAVIDYAVRSSFWRGVIISAEKLREKFDTLDIQREEDANGRNGRHRTGSAANRAGPGGRTRYEVGTPEYYEDAERRMAQAAAANQW